MRRVKVDMVLWPERLLAREAVVTHPQAECSCLLFSPQRPVFGEGPPEKFLTVRWCVAQPTSHRTGPFPPRHHSGPAARTLHQCPVIVLLATRISWRGRRSVPRLAQVLSPRRTRRSLTRSCAPGPQRGDLEHTSRRAADRHGRRAVPGGARSCSQDAASFQAPCKSHAQTTSRLILPAAVPSCPGFSHIPLRPLSCCHFHQVTQREYRNLVDSTALTEDHLQDVFFCRRGRRLTRSSQMHRRTHAPSLESSARRTTRNVSLRHAEVMLRAGLSTTLTLRRSKRLVGRHSQCFVQSAAVDSRPAARCTPVV